MNCFLFLFHILSVITTHCCVFDFFCFLLGLGMKILENLNLKVLNLAFHYQLCIRIIRVHAVVQLVEALRYKSEGHGFCS
jgi:hypothetical protein